MIWRKLLAWGTIGFGGAIMASACAAGGEPEEEGEVATGEEIGTDAAELRAQFCGGIAGIQCPAGLKCIDDPTDDCDPRNGGADCGGICVPGSVDPGPTCDYEDPTKEYIARSPRRCSSIKFYCADGEATPFFDECGCGCQKPPTGEVCGDSVCGPDQYCCNESCGICAPKGGFCTQQFCEAELR